MIIRNSTESDIACIMNLIHQAQLYFKENNIDQWQDGYPNEDNILLDIQKEHSYVLCDNDHIIGTMYFAVEDDPCYKVINGKWRTTHQPYAVIHRIVVDENYKGHSLAGQLLEYAVQQCLKHHVQSIRIDTHNDNKSMQRFLLKNHFELCGGITLESGAPRIGFEKMIE